MIRILIITVVMLIGSLTSFGYGYSCTGCECDNYGNCDCNECY